MLQCQQSILYLILRLTVYFSLKTWLVVLAAILDCG